MLLTQVEENSNKSSHESFEKILIHLNFSQCSDKYKISVIDFVKRFWMSTGLIHMCLQTYGEDGPIAVIEHLIVSYNTALKHEAEKLKSG